MENFSTDREHAPGNPGIGGDGFALNDEFGSPRAKSTHRRIVQRPSQASRFMRIMVGSVLTTTMIATAGFGALPKSPLTEQFREVIDENIPAEFVAPINDALEQAGLETIPASQSLETIYQNDGEPTFLDIVVAVANGDDLSGPNQNSDSEPLLFDALAALFPPQDSQTPTAEFTATLLPTETLTSVVTPTGTSTLITPTLAATITVSNTSTVLPSLTATFVPATIQPSATRTKNPTRTWTPSWTPTFTASPTLTWTPTFTASPTSTWTPTFTASPTSTWTPTLTASPTFTLTSTHTASPTWTPSSTATTVATETASPTPENPPPPQNGFIISAVSFNGAGSVVSVSPDSSVTITYNFQIFSDDCPGCITQLMTGFASSHGGACAYNGSPGIYPGAYGFENITLYAPLTAGTYDVYAVSAWQYNCTDALNAYPSGIFSQIIGQIVVTP